jgi:transcription elongation GreA/GreB family factor
LGDRFDSLNEMVVSTKSPLGQALLGATRGQTVKYNNGFRVCILNKED